MARLVCWVFGHVEVIVGKCSNTKAHYCRKSRLVCTRCKRTHTDQGWRNI